MPKQQKRLKKSSGDDNEEIPFWLRSKIKMLLFALGGLLVLFAFGNFLFVNFFSGGNSDESEIVEVDEPQTELEIARQAIREKDVPELRRLIKQSQKWSRRRNTDYLVKIEQQRVRQKLCRTLIVSGEPVEDEIWEAWAASLLFDFAIHIQNELDVTESRNAIKDFVEFANKHGGAAAKLGHIAKLSVLATESRTGKNSEVLLGSTKELVNAFPKDESVSLRLSNLAWQMILVDSPDAESFEAIFRDYAESTGPAGRTHLATLDDRKLALSLNLLKELRNSRENDGQLTEKQLSGLKRFVGEHASSQFAQNTIIAQLTLLEKTSDVQIELLRAAHEARPKADPVAAVDQQITGCFEQLETRKKMVGSTVDLTGLQCGNKVIEAGELSGKPLLLLFVDMREALSRNALKYFFSRQPLFRRHGVKLVVIAEDDDPFQGEPVLSDENAAILFSRGRLTGGALHPFFESFPITVRPHLVLLDKSGVIRHANLGRMNIEERFKGLSVP